MAIMPLASITNSFTGVGDLAIAAMIWSLMYWAFVNVSGAAVAKTTMPGTCSPGSPRPGRPPNSATWNPRQFCAIGPGNRVKAADEGQYDGEQHAGFDRQRYDERRRSRRRPEFPIRPGGRSGSSRRRGKS